MELAKQYRAEFLSYVTLYDSLLFLALTDGEWLNLLKSQKRYVEKRWL